MPVTEVAILHLQPSVSLTEPSFRAKLLHTKKVMENALGIPGRHFNYYQDIKDPSVLYLLGDWQSPSEHWDRFIPSPENQQMLELLKDDLDLPRIQMYHVDVPNAKIPASAEVVCISWYRVRTEDKVRFEEQVVQRTQCSNDGLSQGREAVGAGGWRIEKPDEFGDEEQWVHFRGRDNVEEHTRSGQTEAWKDDDHINTMVIGSEFKHGIRVDFNP
ncbi:hypothetical protein N0V93_003991 [Gnomoniopsis smithogilvyi]|uniref:ABM domain-containing protein n=1 Tax=Gnomoniopsis smithogilvyi TaxID=1191159 RepID=A0A9W8YZR2_9PEZI|nr:hypothetical protein N0V93_003991 [Gnomoniopsis smithogilvyi]